MTCTDSIDPSFEYREQRNIRLKGAFSGARRWVGREIGVFLARVRRFHTWSRGADPLKTGAIGVAPILTDYTAPNIRCGEPKVAYVRTVSPSAQHQHGIRPEEALSKPDQP